jgi:hypothetical protein
VNEVNLYDSEKGWSSINHSILSARLQIYSPYLQAGGPAEESQQQGAGGEGQGIPGEGGCSQWPGV